jgi:[DsrC]-trisulfide reductase subunit J
MGAMLLTVFASLAVASVDDEDRASRIPKPAEAKPLGDHCVEDTEFMKRNHMKLILHERKLTVHEGIRTKKYSLKNCIYCHATPTKENPEVRSVLGEGHFCQSCHAYNAVKIDCFECHSSKPAGGTMNAHPVTEPLSTSAGDSVRLHWQGASYELGTHLNLNAQAGASK